MLHLLSLWSCISLYFCGGVTSTGTVTTNPQDFDNERFSLVTHSLLEDSGYDFRLATCFMSLTYTSLCCLRLKFEETVHSIKPTITTEMIYMTEPRQGPVTSVLKRYWTANIILYSFFINNEISPWRFDKIVWCIFHIWYIYEISMCQR